ncbi:MAG TPA: DnaJ domain-containing protein [Candidatus Limnocylindria bacterium]|nr:DnaJ domain-containing protein [Candidatus Limnocylindria bacterium]
MRDPRVSLYRILMVTDNADQEIITLVHRRLAKRYHPDIDPGPEAARRMAEINEAYHVLSNPERRAAYDAQLAARRDRRSSDRLRRGPGDVPYGAAGAPLGPPSGSVINIGRYSGWSLGQIRRHDPSFLEWLLSVPAGRQYRDEIQSLLRRS